jgi:hypothetical protein
MNKKAYLRGYMYKEANPAASAAGTAGLTLLKEVPKGVVGAFNTVLDKTVDMGIAALPYMVALPFVFGAAGGYAHSKLTSPTPQDLETAQKAMTSAELDEMLTNLRRQKAQSLKKEEQAKGITNERSLHI